MTYIFATVFCLTLPLIYIFLIGSRIGFSSALIKIESILGVLCGSAFNFAIMLGLSIHPSSDNIANWTPLINLCFGIISLPVYLYLLNEVLKLNGKSVVKYLAEGIGVIAVISAGYLAFAGFDHWLFWRDSSASVKPSAQVRKYGVTCEYKYIFVRQENNIEYFRCPTNIVLGSLQKHPFAPWPAYSEEKFSVKTSP